MTTTATQSISLRLRERTAAAHESAERTEFLGLMLGGKLNVDAWAHLLQQYGAIYAALEQATAGARERGELLELFIPELDRSEFIAADLEQLAPRLSAPLPGILPETQAYVAVIHAAANDPARLLAHHYTRYLGDLSGGQIMRTMIDRSYGLPDAQARFFAFDEIPKLVPFKRDYRAKLDALPFDEAQITRLLDEANESFAHNERIFEALHQRVAPAA